MGDKQNSTNHIKLKPVFICFAAWRLMLFLLAAVANRLLVYQPSFPYSSLLAQSNLPAWIYSFANFDGVHYLTIAQNGYIGTGLIQAFFPVYPLLIKVLSLVVSNYIIAGLLISNLAFLLALYCGAKIVAKDFDQQTARWWLLVMLTFPSSFYFACLYTESLFLLLVFYSIWFMRDQKKAISALLSGLSSGVRLVGIMLLPTIYLEWREQQPDFSSVNGLKKIKKLLPFILSATGLVAFMLFLYAEFNDPLYFFSVQSEFGAGRSESLVLLPQVFYRYVKILLTARPIDLKYFTYVQDLLLTIVSFVILFLWWRETNKKSYRISYLWFALPALLLPTFTGTFSSMPRYILVIFPLQFWLAAKLKKANRVCKIVYLTVSVLLLAVNTILFVQGYWVA